MKSPLAPHAAERIAAIELADAEAAAQAAELDRQRQELAAARAVAQEMLADAERRRRSK
jgi:F0F1-type ATP synthase membrane subunit b/b'